MDAHAHTRQLKIIERPRYNFSLDNWKWPVHYTHLLISIKCLIWLDWKYISKIDKNRAKEFNHIITVQLAENVSSVCTSSQMIMELIEK